MANPLSLIGIFMIGASAGSLITWMRQGRMLAEYRRLVDQRSPGSQMPADRQPRFGIKALVVSSDLKVINLFSTLFRERRIETLSCSLASDAQSQLSSEKFEALVLDCDRVEGCVDLLKNLPGPHKQVVVVAIATEVLQRKSASERSASLVVQRPLDIIEIRQLLRAAYGRMLRDLQTYFRLAVALPVTIRTVSGYPVQGRTLNLSQNGMAVTTRIAFGVGARVNVVFAIPGSTHCVNGNGEVIWDDKHGKTGIRFQCTNAREQVKFFEWLHDHLIMALDTEGDPLAMSDAPPLSGPMGNWN